jgi:hypothetical protein
MNRIFGIGLSRTGNKSLARALRTLGFDAHHWPTSMHELENHQAVTDITVSCRFKELDRSHPASLFIYTVRDRPSWLKSCKGHWSRLNKIRGTSKLLPFAERAEIALYGTLQYNESILIEAYERHDKSVMEYFKQRPDDLLVLDIIGGQGWDALCGFLSRPVPSVKFPHANPGYRSGLCDHRIHHE